MPVKLCALVLAAVCLSACGDTASDSDGGAAAGDSKPRIAVIPKGTTHVFWQSVKAGAFAARDELGIHVEFKGPTKEDDRNSQISLLERMVTSRKFDGILLAPLDDTALVSPVEHAVEKNLPVGSNRKSLSQRSFLRISSSSADPRFPLGRGNPVRKIFSSGTP